MNKPVVSVVIPAHNATDLIVNALDSVRAQTFRDYEVIVVDNGSTDDTYGLVSGYIAGAGMRGRCVRQENRGIAGARNRGLAEASGEYIALLDHDDTWTPDKLERVLSVFSDDPGLCVVCSKARMVNERGEVIGVLNTGPDQKDIYTALLFKRNYLAVSYSVFKRSCALEIGGFRTDPVYSTVEDYDFWIRLSRKCRFRFIPDLLGDYMVRSTSASAAVSSHFSNLRSMLEEHLLRYTGNGNSLALKLRIRVRLLSLYRIRLVRLFMNLSSSNRVFGALFRLAKRIRG